MQCSSDISSNIVSYDPQHIPPENSSFLDRNFMCRFRCLLDNSSGFLALNFQGRLKYLHGQNRVAEDGTTGHPQLALFAIATPVQPPSIMEIRTKTLIFQSKHKLDFTPTGIDTRGKVVLGYTEMELCLRGSGYQFIHAADMMYCADNHVRMMKTGESGFTVFRLLTKTGAWVWVQANARLVYKGGRPDFIIARQRALTNEEGEEQLRQRKMQLPFNFATGEGVLYDTGPTLDLASENGKGAKIRKIQDQKDLNPDSLLGSLLKQDQSIYIQPPDADPQFSLEKAFMDSHALLSIPGDTWQKPTGVVKEESAMQAMIDTLEQIVGDRAFCSSMEELDTAELKEWENALLRMNIRDNDMSVELNDILTNDIFSYVEEALFKEASVSPSSGQLSAMETNPAPPRDFPSNPLGNQASFVEVPGSLPDVELQTSMLTGSQGFNHCNSILIDQARAEPQTSFLGVGGQGAGNEVRGMQKLTHVGPQIPAQMQQSEVFTPPLELPDLRAQSGLVNFDPALASAGSRGQAHSIPGPKAVHGPSTVNGLCSRNQIRSSPHSARQIHSNPMAPSLQNQMHPEISVQPMAFQQQNSTVQSNQVLLTQDSQWVSSIPNTNFAENLLETCASNVSVQPDLFSPSLPACLQGQFSLQTQSSANQRLQPWKQQPQKPQPLTASTQNGHQNPSSCFSQVHSFQRSPPEAFLQQSVQNCGVGYTPVKMASSTYPPHPQGELLVDAPPTTSSSCMFKSSDPPTNGVHFNDIAPVVTPTVSCPTQVPPYNQSPPQASCYFQRNASEPIAGTMAIPQGDTNVSPPSCQIAPNFTQENLLAQAQYLNCSSQTQISSHPEENRPFAFHPLTNGTTYFSESNQTNCCDF
ncbi:hypothetical protein JZ751_029509 [Albula glossodonta]|uniref:PAS fold-3 domain-containing protein n=1 Tax=Albula glossodonta TaxID=121402 RepID=A0A8T2P9H6_9TELE|nr:hypothetical protein JZ751_029509 [Albula glossodonta]